MAKLLARQTALQQLKDFDLTRARVSLWVFKKRNAGGSALAFSAYWVDIAPRLAKELKDIAKITRDTFTEVSDYGLRQQPNEAGLLAIPSSDTQFQALVDAVGGREEKAQATSRKDLDNAAGYVVKIVAKRPILYCVRKATSEWKSTRSSSLLNLVFVQQQLDIEDDPVFRVARTFDFFATNAMQLRRMAVIRDKGLYRDKKYVERLRDVNGARGWGITFDADGRIVQTGETARIILQVLLDHRLYSELSLATYDVPSATPV